MPNVKKKTWREGKKTNVGKKKKPREVVADHKTTHQIQNTKRTAEAEKRSCEKKKRKRVGSQR